MALKLFKAIFILNYEKKNLKKKAINESHRKLNSPQYPGRGALIAGNNSLIHVTVAAFLDT